MKLSEKFILHPLQYLNFDSDSRYGTFFKIILLKFAHTSENKNLVLRNFG